MSFMRAGQVIKYEDKQIIVEERLGRGSFGIVYKCLLQGYGYIAVKTQNMMRNAMELRDTIMIEKKVAETVSEEYAMTLKKVICRSNFMRAHPPMIAESADVPPIFVLTLYDFADGIELQNLIHTNANANVQLTADVAKQYAMDLLGCLNELKSKGIAHRDLKPSNLILHKGHIRMIDFGFACFLANCVGVKGTPKFFPPEVYRLPEHLIDWHKSDIFAMGMTLFSLITNGHTMYEHLFASVPEGVEFFTVNSSENVDKRIEQIYDALTPHFPILSTFKKLIMGMLRADPDTRFDVATCFQNM